jgi:A/G-specific adenine glycosylase
VVFNGYLIYRLKENPMTIANFNRTIWRYYKREGRHDLPWRKTKDPYAILVSEIMLQQTQVGRVEEYYKRFLKQFPNFISLASAKTSDVLTAWQGLGYNRRAIFLKQIAKVVVSKFNGKLPNNREALESLPGIGKGTSGSLMAFAFNMPETFIETNIRRVFIHFFFKHKSGVTDEELSRYIEGSVDHKNAREWYWALMDYGTFLKTSLKIENPNRRSAHYTKQSAFAGSDRELRGKILRAVLSKKKVQSAKLLKELAIPKKRFEKVVNGLCEEAFLVKKGDYICINT